MKQNKVLHDENKRMKQKEVDLRQLLNDMAERLIKVETDFGTVQRGLKRSWSSSSGGSWASGSTPSTEQTHTA